MIDLKLDKIIYIGIQLLFLSLIGLGIYILSIPYEAILSYINSFRPEKPYQFFTQEYSSYLKMAVKLFISLIIVFIISAHFLRGTDKNSQQLFLWIILIVIFSDTGGYFSGKIIGGKKLTKISPNKTISGMIGSFGFATFPIFIIYFLHNSELIIFEQLTLSIKTIMLSLLFSLVSQFGDLTISYFKRKNKIKDTGNILPGHGGLLDRIDGLIFLLIFSAILKFVKII